MALNSEKMWENDRSELGGASINLLHSVTACLVPSWDLWIVWLPTKRHGVQSHQSKGAAPWIGMATIILTSVHVQLSAADERR